MHMRTDYRAGRVATRARGVARAPRRHAGVAHGVGEADEWWRREGGAEAAQLLAREQVRRARVEAARAPVAAPAPP